VDGTWAQLSGDAAVRALVAEVVATVNAALSKTDRIQQFAITDREFSVEGGELTPTMKVVRRVIAERYATIFEAMYR
jgi:long-chain acyl-CoA synthetase